MKAKTIQKIEEIKKCPECNSKELKRDQNRAELVCNNCGLVLDENLIDYSPEWRAYDHEQHEKRARTGSPMTPLLHDKGLSTTIGWQNRDSYGKSIPNKNRSRVYRIRKWQRRMSIGNGTERNLAEALRSLNRMSSAMSLPRIIRENAAMIYRDAVTKNLIRGRSIDSIVAAAIYAACRKCNIPKTLSEVNDKTNIPIKVIGRNYRHLARQLKLKLLPTSSKDYIPVFCNKLRLGTETQKKAVGILEMASEKELTSGKAPTSVAAASIYMAAVLCGDRRTQKEVAEVSGVTEVTIRNHYKFLAEKLDIAIEV